MTLIESFLTSNPCYIAARKIAVKGLMLHSLGCSQPSARTVINDLNSGCADRCVHAVIDGNHGTVYQTLPWDSYALHCGGSGNEAYIGIEMCEPSCIRYTDGTHFEFSGYVAATVAVRTYDAAVELSAMLCEKFALDPLEDGVILSHSEGHKRGIASERGDPEHLWSQLGVELSMDSFRAAVSKAMSDRKTSVGSKDNTRKSVSAGTTEELAYQQFAKQSYAVKKIYFTFDDGPSCLTEPLLEILRKHRVKASFFVTDEYHRSDMLKKIAEDGHTICLHSYSHDYKTVYSSPEGYFDDLKKIDDLVYETVGLRPKIVRLPGGSNNSVHRDYCEGIIPVILSGLRERGYQVIDWDVDNSDGFFYHLPPESYFLYFLSSLPDKEEVVFLSHTRDGDEDSVRSIDLILDFCEKNGWKTDTIENYRAPDPADFRQNEKEIEQKSKRRYDPHLTLVNKRNVLHLKKIRKLKIATYEDIPGYPVKIEVNTLIAFLKMKYYLSEHGVYVGINSAFRSIPDQKAIWDMKMRANDFDFNETIRMAALPQMSEHHTGLAVDIMLNENGEWVKAFSDHEREKEIYSFIHRICPRFGFILRYPQGKEDITGYCYEPWHLRYVGIKHAKAITKNGLTLEEYKTLLPE